MKLIKPSVDILPYTGNILKDIEIAGRTCYKSEDCITDESAPKFVQILIDRGHTAMLEHGTVYLHITYTDENAFEYFIVRNYRNNKYSKVVTMYEEFSSPFARSCYITTNYRVLVENNWLSDLEYQCEPTKIHEKRISVKFICDRGIWNEHIRHRIFQKIDEDDFITYGSIGEDADKFSFAQESTRYCNYSKDKFGNQLTFIIPCWMNLQEGSYDYDWDSIDNVIYWGWYNNDTRIKSDLSQPTKGVYDIFLGTLTNIEDSYFNLLERGWQPQQARDILPNSLKTELIMTGFVSDWLGFFDLRCAEAAHPQMRELAIPLKQMFIDNNLIEV